MSASTIGRRHHVVIVGCGFGGLFAAKTLRRAEVDVTVIDRTNHHLFQPLLYQVATGILSVGDIAPPIRDVLRHQWNTRVVLGEVIVSISTLAASLSTRLVSVVNDRQNGTCRPRLDVQRQPGPWTRPISSKVAAIVLSHCVDPRTLRFDRGTRV